MKIHGLKASKLDPKSTLSLAEILDYCSSLPLKDRYRNGMRLEQCQKSGITYYLDFTKLRRAVLPGKATPITPTTSLGLTNSESVSEETAAMFDAQNSTFILQFNMHGPHKGLIQAYLNSFAAAAYQQKHGSQPSVPPDISLDHILNKKAQAQFNRLTIFKKLELKVANPSASARNVPTGQSLSSVIDSGFANGAENTLIELSSGRKKAASLVPEFVKKSISTVFSLGHVEKLVVTGKEDVGSETIILDLIEQTLKADKKIQPGLDRRLPLGDRWKALYDQGVEWSSSKLLN